MKSFRSGEHKSRLLSKINLIMPGEDASMRNLGRFGFQDYHIYGYGKPSKVWKE
ncbi:uncharacterized protein G2W53_008720 [Senna tora]|uniref:Uncharacterized protein n=1 Tax=Senna tora TaxID=362788 RepID=A0A834XAP3_9FABA|nr:uncharacterized protein G2W53_008720 [Senna tora]